jgi:ribose transport system ATP-binding protein
MEAPQTQRDPSPAAGPAVGETPWLQVQGLAKQFGGAAALAGVDLDVHRGEVHGLVGANGAGKSTLIRCLAGVVAPDEGTICVDGSAVTVTGPAVAERSGFAFIHQELNLVPHFDAVENMLLGIRKDSRFGLVDWRRSRARAAAVAERLGVTFSLDRRVDELTVGERWLVMIGRALVLDARLIAMDEPTASLSAHEGETLMRIVRDLAAGGVSILYVSHRLDEVLDLSDRITVFRDGRVTDRAVRGEIDKRGLVRAIAGREVVAAAARDRAEVDRSGAPLFSARGVRAGSLVRDVTFDVHRGEVVGLGGLVGAGRTEVARAAFGADRLEAGTFVLEGRELPTGSVPAAVRAGVGLVPEERRSQGLVLEKSVAYNVNLGVLGSLRAVRGLPFVSDRGARRRAAGLVERLRIKTPSLSAEIGGLSGGNQQKALIARWLRPGLRLLFLDEPSRGVDVGARQEIHDAVRELADSGVGTVVISSDVEELVQLCDRVVVLAEGVVTGELVGSEITETRIIELSYAHSEQGEPQ